MSRGLCDRGPFVVRCHGETGAIHSSLPIEESIMHVGLFVTLETESRLSFSKTISDFFCLITS